MLPYSTNDLASLFFQISLAHDQVTMTNSIFDPAGIASHNLALRKVSVSPRPTYIKTGWRAKTSAI
jgi:hypothetical protein